MKKAIQDCYPDELSHCYGCGRNNPDGHQIKTYWTDDDNDPGSETVAHFLPRDEYRAIPGFVYGGPVLTGLLRAVFRCRPAAAAGWPGRAAA